VAAESGGNAGSDLGLLSYTDAAAALYWTLYCARATGNITIGTSGDQGAKLSVFSTNVNQPVVRVRGAASQGSYLQTWENSAGTRVASIDPAGTLYLATNPFIMYQPSYNRVGINTSSSGNSLLGDIHIGALSGGVFHGSIAMEQASGVAGSEPLPASVIRIYWRSSYFVINFNYGGTQVYLTVPLQGATGTATWSYGTTAP
jgi:hypothetical protein